MRRMATCRRVPLPTTRAVADPCSDSFPADRSSPLDRAELALCAALGRIVADVELAVDTVDDPSEELFERLDDDLSMLSDGIDAFRRAVRSADRERAVDVARALRDVLDHQLGELEVPLTIHAAVAEGLPRLGLPYDEFLPLLERTLKALLDAAMPGDELAIAAALIDEDVQLDLALLPADGRPDRAASERFAARTVTLTDFVSHCGGRAGVAVDDGFRVWLRFTGQTAGRG